MKCPYCQKMMDEGYIENPRDVVAWIPKGAYRGLRERIFPRSEKKFILAGKYNFIEGGSAEAYYCNNCKKIIIDVDSQ